MKKIIACIVVVAGAFLASAQSNSSPFTSQPPSSQASTTLSKITQFTYKIQKKRIELFWTVERNEESNYFEIEKSKDGKTYSTAALVFCTDKANTDTYSFYEAVKSTTNYYRIKILHKDNSITYSDAIIAKAG